MRAFVVLLAVFTIALARPDVSHLGGHHHHHQQTQGYDYNKPSDNFVGLPPLVTDANGRQPPNSYIPPASGNPFGNGLDTVTPTQFTNGATYQQSGSGVGGSGVSYSGSSGGGDFLKPPISSNGATLLHSSQSSQGLNQQYATQSSLGQQQSYQSVQQLPPIITKHFYVHAAPEDPEEQAGPRFVQVGRARKNYKVIFIKAPTYGSSQQIIPVLPQNEEKTIVYVLSKKPLLNQEVQVPEQPVTEPTKPDVFFIKYKNQEEAQQAQQHIQAQYEQANAAQIASQQASLSGSGLSGSSTSTNAGSQVGQTGQYSQASGQGQTDQYTQTGQYTQQQGAFLGASSATSGASNYAAPSANSLSSYSTNQNYLPPNH